MVNKEACCHVSGFHDRVGLNTTLGIPGRCGRCTAGCWHGWSIHVDKPSFLGLVFQTVFLLPFIAFGLTLICLAFPKELQYTVCYVAF